MPPYDLQMVRWTGSSIIALTTLFDSADAETGGMQFSADIGLHSQFIGTVGHGTAGVPICSDISFS